MVVGGGKIRNLLMLFDETLIELWTLISFFNDITLVVEKMSFFQLQSVYVPGHIRYIEDRRIDPRGEIEGGIRCGT